MGKTAKVKKIGEEVVKKRIDWKSILKKTWKIVFNTSAVAGIASAGVIGATKLNVVPGSVKQNVAEVIQEYENPIAEALKDPNACDTSYTSPAIITFVKNFGDTHEYREVCVHNDEVELVRRLRTDVQTKAYEVNSIEVEVGGNACDEAGTCEYITMMINESKIDTDTLSQQCPHWNYPEEIYVLGQSLTLSKQYDETRTLEQAIDITKQQYEELTCDGKLASYVVYKLTGDKMPYYDYVNKKVIEYAEEF